MFGCVGVVGGEAGQQRSAAAYASRQHAPCATVSSWFLCTGGATYYDLGGWPFRRLVPRRRRPAAAVQRTNARSVVQGTYAVSQAYTRTRLAFRCCRASPHLHEARASPPPRTHLPSRFAAPQRRSPEAAPMRLAFRCRVALEASPHRCCFSLVPRRFAASAPVPPRCSAAAPLRCSGVCSRRFALWRRGCSTWNTTAP